MLQILRRIALLLLLVLLVGCEPSAPPSLAVGRNAPEIEGQDVDGIPIRLSRLKGKVVLLDFWATWCGHCLKLVPRQRELMNHYKDRPFTILGINTDADVDDAHAYLRRANLPWPNILDRKRDIIQAWGADVLPFFVLIDADGVIRGRWRGAGDFDEIVALTAQLVEAHEKR